MNDVKVPSVGSLELLLPKHVEYLNGYGIRHDLEAYRMSDYLRVSGMYWAITGMQIMKQELEMTEEAVATVYNDCFDRQTGGFRPWKGQDVHMLFTLSAVQILASTNRLSLLSENDKDLIVNFIRGLQQSDGSFAGDTWGEIDSRFSFCAVATLMLIGKNPEEVIRLEDAIDFIWRCQAFDGGFGLKPGSESHAGNIFCCLGFLSLVNRLDVVNDVDQLGWWLCERQLSQSGGLNGRPEKLPDVCYSWWVLSSLVIINRLHWIDRERLVQFILASQDEETGGFSDRPGYASDPFHTLFGLAGLALTGMYRAQLEDVNPVFCMTQKIVTSLGIKTPSVRF